MSYPQVSDGCALNEYRLVAASRDGGVALFDSGPIRREIDIEQMHLKYHLISLTS